LRIYVVAKMFVLAFMFAVYVLFLTTVAVAYFSGGWVVVLVDKYREGLAELVLLASLLPVVAYVTFKEIAAARRAKKTIISNTILAGVETTKCRWCKKEIPKEKYLKHLLECEKYREWLEKTAHKNLSSRKDLFYA